MEQNIVKFLYLNIGDGKVTVAIRTYNDNTVKIGVAFCSPKDRFVKAVGRNIATWRLDDKKDFYIHFERNLNTRIEDQIKDIIKFAVAGQWVTVLDFDTEIETTIYEIVTETCTDFPCEIAPMTVHTNTIPYWAKRAVLENNLY